MQTCCLAPARSSTDFGGSCLATKLLLEAHFRCSLRRLTFIEGDPPVQMVLALGMYCYGHECNTSQSRGYLEKKSELNAMSLALH